MENKTLSVEEAKDIVEASVIAQKAQFAIDDMANTEKKYLGKDNMLAVNFFAQMGLVNASQEFFAKKGIDLNFDEYVSPEITSKIDVYKKNGKNEYLKSDEIKEFINGFYEYNIAILGQKGVDKINGVLDKEKFNACFATLMWVPVDETTIKGKRSKPMRDLWSWVYTEQAIAKDRRAKIANNMDNMKDIYMKKAMAPVINNSANEMIDVGLLSNKETAENLFKGVVFYSKSLNKQDVNTLISTIIDHKEKKSDASAFAHNVSVKVLENPYFKHEAQSVIDKSFKIEEQFLEEKRPLLTKSRASINEYSEVIKTSFEYFKKFDKYEEANKNVMIIKGRGNSGR